MKNAKPQTVKGIKVKSNVKAGAYNNRDSYGAPYGTY